MTFLIHSFTEPDVPQQLDGAALQHAYADALEHMVLALSFEDYALDPIEMQEVRK
jgi:hypothetical protein